jgi:hypothetical protein
MKNQIHPGFRPLRRLATVLDTFIDEPAHHRTVPLPGYRCHRKYLPWGSRSEYSASISETRGIFAAAHCRDSDVAVLFAVDHGSRGSGHDPSGPMW